MAEKSCACPFCKAEIPLSDVNVATDVALCRACGKISPFSALREVEQISQVDLDSLPRGVKSSSDCEGNVKIVYKKLSFILLFFIPFTACWSGFSIWGIYLQPILTQGKLPLVQALFGIPFLLGTIVLLSIIIFLLFGRWEILLCGGNGSVFLGLGSLGWRRVFSLSRDSAVFLRVSALKVNGVPQKAVCIRNGSAEFMFGSTMSDAAKSFIAAVIQKEASKL